jgi:hypothetical protein
MFDDGGCFCIAGFFMGRLLSFDIRKMAILDLARSSMWLAEGGGVRGCDRRVQGPRMEERL